MLSFMWSSQITKTIKAHSNLNFNSPCIRALMGNRYERFLKL